MRTRALITALLGVIIAGSAPSTNAWAKKKGVKTASLDASSCPDFSQNTDNRAKAITFRFANRCPQAIRCVVAWAVSCPGSDGGGKHEESVDLDGSADQSLEASASACGDGSWRITPAEWKCHFKPNESDTALR